MQVKKISKPNIRSQDQSTILFYKFHTKHDFDQFEQIWQPSQLNLCKIKQVERSFETEIRASHFLSHMITYNLFSQKNNS